MVKTVIELEEKRLEKLAPKELSRELMYLPAKRRMEVILRRTDIEAVVGALPEQDFYFSVMEIGADDSLPLLAAASVGQLNHLFDLEWWQKDDLNPAKAVKWLERLARASEEKLIQWLYEVDFELLVVLFKKWLHVKLVREEIDLAEAREELPANTLDDQYFWESRYPQYEELIKRVLSIFFELNYSFYRELMNSIIWEVDVESEEAAFRFHRARLEERAIPDFYGAIEIYRSMRTEDIPHRKEPIAIDPDAPATPSFALALVPEGDLLDQALREVRDPAVLDGIQLELASLANKVVIADQLSPESPEALHGAVEKTVAYVNLGLHLNSGGHLQAAISILEEVYLEHLFRLAQGSVARLRARLQQELKSGWLSEWPQGLKCLDPDWMEQAELLLGRTPRLLRARPGTSPTEEYFRTPEDVVRAEHTLEIIQSVGPLYRALDVRFKVPHWRLWESGQIGEFEDVTLGSMIWTAAARLQLEGDFRVEPIPVELWPELWPRIGPDALERAIRSWVGEILPDPDKRVLAEAYLLPVFKSYREEMAPFAGDQPPDAQLVRLFLFSE